MRVVRFHDNSGRVQYGVDLGGGRAQPLVDMFAAKVRPMGEPVAIVKRLAPVNPTNIICIGKNYAAHAKEFDSELPEHPILFMKPTSAVCDPGDPIRIPAACEHGPEVDYEAELAVVIGPRAARDVKPEDALDFVLGYTCANDVSARRWQKHGGGGQWVRGKSFDTFCPLGPVLVTADEISDPQGLGVRCVLNGELMQDGHTRDMIFPVAELIAFISRDTTLLPGTVVLTGTPSGVGFARTPPVFLAPGDEVTIEIDGIGRLTNPVESA